MKIQPILTLGLACCLAASAVWAGQIVVEKKELGGDTIIYCSPAGTERISRAHITIYQTSEGMPLVAREEMEVAADGNKASYVLLGLHRQIDGRCRLLVDSDQTPAGVTPLSENSNRILNQEFSFVSP